MLYRLELLNPDISCQTRAEESGKSSFLTEGLLSV